MRVQITIEGPGVPRRRARGALAALALSLALVVPGVVLASHLFSDVPDSNPFHGNITALAEAGITAGCTASTYCPSATVTREQMAAFLQRGLPRAAMSEIGITNVPIDVTPIDTFQITPGIPGGAVAGATQFVHVTSTFTIYQSSASGCPCIFRSYIKVDGVFATPRVVDVTLSVVGARAPIAITGIAPVTGSGPKLVEVILTRVEGSGSAQAYGQTVATTVAYGAAGTKVLSPFAAVGTVQDGTESP